MSEKKPLRRRIRDRDLVLGTFIKTANPAVLEILGYAGFDFAVLDCEHSNISYGQIEDSVRTGENVGLPIIVHDREAHQDCLQIVRQHPNVTGVYHCYSGSLEDAKTLVKLGWMLSFTGVVTYKNARKSLEVIEWLPMDRIMIETDSPYLTPEPFRGKRNDSGKVHLVAETIARVKGLSPEEVAQITLENGKRFFNIQEDMK